MPDRSGPPRRQCGHEAASRLAHQDDDALHRLRRDPPRPDVARPEGDDLGERGLRAAVEARTARRPADRAALPDSRRRDQVGQRRGHRARRGGGGLRGGLRPAHDPLRPGDGHEQHHLPQRPWAHPAGAPVLGPRHGGARAAAALRFPAVLQHLQPQLDLGRRRDGPEHQPPAPRRLSRGRRHQDRLHPRGGVQPRVLRAARQPPGDRVALRRPQLRHAQRRSGAPDGPRLLAHAGPGAGRRPAAAPARHRGRRGPARGAGSAGPRRRADRPQARAAPRGSRRSRP
jgi:hypothetical protein